MLCRMGLYFDTCLTSRYSGNLCKYSLIGAYSLQLMVNNFQVLLYVLISYISLIDFYASRQFHLQDALVFDILYILHIFSYRTKFSTIRQYRSSRYFMSPRNVL